MKNHRSDFDNEGGFRGDRGIQSPTGRVSGLVVAVIVIVIIIGVIATSGFVRVPAGTRGVLLTFGKVEDKIRFLRKSSLQYFITQDIAVDKHYIWRIGDIPARRGRKVINDYYLPCT